MDSKTFKIDNIPEDSSRGSRMSPPKQRKLTKFMKGCSLSQLLAFGILCLLAGSLLTVGVYSALPVDKSINGALERCFRSKTPVDCESQYTRALAKWILAEDYREIPLDEVKLADHVNWTKLDSFVAQMQGAIEANQTKAAAELLVKMYEELNAGFNKL